LLEKVWIPIVEKITNKVIQKYQQASCEQLWEGKEPAETTTRTGSVHIVGNDPKMREAFINKVAVPVANKMFECGMIP
jgi:hypothetical protein